MPGLKAVENLIRTFLPAGSPEPPPEVAGDDGAITTARPTVKGGPPTPGDSSSSPRGEGSDGHKCHGGADTGSDPAKPLADHASQQQQQEQQQQQRRSGYGKGAAPGAGTTSTSRTASGSDQVDSASVPFWDEAGPDGPGLLMSSPPDPEPMLSPLSSVYDLEAAGETPAVGPVAPSGVSPNAIGPAGSACAGGGSGPSVPASRFLSGLGGGAMCNDSRLWLVYDGASAAGKGVISRVNAPDPYWLGRASPGAVCPHPHSMKFYSSFEGANLLRAVQVRAETLHSPGDGRRGGWLARGPGTCLMRLMEPCMYRRGEGPASKSFGERE